MPFNSCLCRRSPCRGSAAARVPPVLATIACTCWRCRIHRTGGGAGRARRRSIAAHSRPHAKHAEQIQHAKTCPRKTNGVRSPLSSFSWHSLHRAKLLLSRRVSDIWGVGYGGVPFAASDQPHTVPRANADVTRVTSTSGEGDTCYIYICIYIYIYIYIYHRGRGPIPPPPLLLPWRPPYPTPMPNMSSEALVGDRLRRARRKKAFVFVP